jgi:hypothetical protein
MQVGACRKFLSVLKCQKVTNAYFCVVIAVPYFTEEPENVNAAEDETIEFRCKASGVPEPQIKWIHNGRPISEATINVRRKVTPNSIVIQNLKKNDTGNYGCNATNSLGYVYKDVYVNVLGEYVWYLEETK